MHSSRKRCAMSSAKVDGLGPYDARSVANLLLDEADRIGISVTNLALQKLLYFAHGFSLVQERKSLVVGYFEAWHYGPAHPTVYDAFKSAKGSPIRFRAERRDALTGKWTPLPKVDDQGVMRLIQKVLAGYGRSSTGRLVDIAHAKGAPWEFIVRKSENSVVFGMRIPDDVIVAKFKHHMVSVGDAPRVGEPSEDSPLA